jgi:NAD(P)-dependent dehydrogenase (short-subunit alcohol dehydrogenase family)
MLTDKVCIVNGGGHGIGRATAYELADHGATVVINDLGASEHGEGQSEEPAETVARELREEGHEAMAHFGDVSSLDYTERLVNDTVDEYGRIDAVANFAGILRDSLIHKMTADEWDDVIRVHLRGHFSLLHYVSAQWRESAREQDDFLEPQRSFLAVSSQSAMGNVGQMNYSAAKAGVLGLVRAAARELSRYNIRVNALMPRAHTRLVDTMPEQFQPDDLPDPEDLAPLNAFLLSEDARDVSGRTILAGGDEIGVVSDPEVYRTALREGGWTFEALSKSFKDTLERDDNFGRFFEER